MPCSLCQNEAVYMIRYETPKWRCSDFVCADHLEQTIRKLLDRKLIHVVKISRCSKEAADAVREAE